jgi:ribosomal protein L11 methylase PrmA
VFHYEPPAPFDIVAANIEAPILLEAAGRFSGHLCSSRPGAALLLAGILERQYAGVADAFAQLGFRERLRLSLEGWTSGWWERR